MGEVPLGLLELAVQRVIQENTYNIVPVLFQDKKMAKEDWAQRRWKPLLDIPRVHSSTSIVE
jgi:hypothetical protein